MENTQRPAPIFNLSDIIDLAISIGIYKERARALGFELTLDNSEATQARIIEAKRAAVSAAEGGERGLASVLRMMNSDPNFR